MHKSTFDKIKHRGIKQRALLNKKKMDTNLEKFIEKAKLESIVLPYLVKLNKWFNKTNSKMFWTFPDKEDLYQIKMSYCKMQKLLLLDIPKYANSTICLIKISFKHNESKNSIYKCYNIFLVVSITIYNIDSDGMLYGKHKPNAITFYWTLEEFKLCQFTYKLLKTIMHIMLKKKYNNTNLIGFPISTIIKDFDINSNLLPLC